jgi:hypothetical protein
MKREIFVYKCPPPLKERERRTQQREQRERENEKNKIINDKKRESFRRSQKSEERNE